MIFVLSNSPISVDLKTEYYYVYFHLSSIVYFSPDETGLSFKCLFCLPKQKIVSASQSSNANLRTHIKLVHSHRLNDFNKVFKKEIVITLFKNANLKLIINTVLPFSLIEHPAFIDYCKVTSSKVPVSRRTLMRDVEILLNSLIEELKIEFKTVQYVCLNR
ncbi:Uncharacterized protein FWK35_00022877 [Aphis craccivora]|uniref:Uncharacterized protein n=1 Tax=Aphis craccivora TaxID=307492 RepID=A0A6G0Y298_APHCR|nr:Uncharacterized protein FWK35_00022877 [Aphis craccivora]